MKRSIVPRGQCSCATVGSSCFTGGVNDQWACHSAPSAIQRRSVSISSGVSVLWLSAGGIRSDSSSLVMRAINSLASGSPGDTGVIPDSASPIALSRWSSRKPALRDAASGPWQAKHLSDRIGRTSRLKLTGTSPAAALAVAKTSKHPSGDKSAAQHNLGDFRAPRALPLQGNHALSINQRIILADEAQRFGHLGPLESKNRRRQKRYPNPTPQQTKLVRRAASTAGPGTTSARTRTRATRESIPS